MKNIMITVLTVGMFCPMVIFAADNVQVPNVNPVPTQVHIRSLAASCAACHGTQGKAATAPLRAGADVTASLAGVDKNHITQRLMTFKSGAGSPTVMHRHAKGLTDNEIIALAEYFSAQANVTSAPLNSQKLRADHAH